MQENQSIRTGFPKATKILVEKLPVKEDEVLSFKTQPSYIPPALVGFFKRYHANNG